MESETIFKLTSQLEIIEFEIEELEYRRDVLKEDHSYGGWIKIEVSSKLKYLRAKSARITKLIKAKQSRLK